MRRRRRFDRTAPELTGPRINDQIRVPRVLLIDENGTRLGEFMTRDAQEIAQERGLDLVEVAPNARPPVCRIQDFGRYKYEQSRRAREARQNQHRVQLKEIKLRPKTDEHDMDVRVRRARTFLEQGHKVKLTVRFRGREHAHHDIGAEQCMRIVEELGDLARIDSPPRMNGRMMHMIISPTRPPVQGPRANNNEEDVSSQS